MGVTEALSAQRESRAHEDQDSSRTGKQYCRACCEDVEVRPVGRVAPAAAQAMSCT